MFSGCRTQNRISPENLEKHLDFTIAFEQNQPQDRKDNYIDINFIRRAFYAVAYVFSSSKELSKFQLLIGKFVEHATNLFLTIYTINELVDVLSLFYHIPIGYVFSSLVTNFCVIGVRFLLLFKRRTILSTLQHLQRIHLKLQTPQRNDQSKKLRLLTGFCSCFIIPSSFFLQTVQLCFKERLLKSYVEDDFFGWSSQEKWINCAMLSSHDLIVLNQKYTLPGFSIVLCCYVFGLLRRILDSFAMNIEKKDDFQELLNFYLKKSKQIQHSIRLVENSFSLLLLIIYGYMLCSIFNVSTLILRVNPKNTDMRLMIPHYIAMLVVLVAFYITSLRATAIHETAVKIRDSICKMTALLESSDYAQKCLLLSAVQDFPPKIVVTGWGLFKLNRSFIRRTAGGIITYAILLSQIDK
ncbi:hypothetical protein AVEN_170197-1 [Araneus ventricosus]|uniref:Gustatory receptor n=1 Tax=Araneus ventricosus TaxID=182803 RepID=A0A4Y2Q4W6_ARAVE|nr:hypothetical protein AVEN_216098-1 [Araneus ventricosus]GBN57940.1 hypothetical protein AVEN_170197-1 [Araneus ventricosus]